jgi:hypothetical protein
MRLTQADIDSVDLERLRPYVASPEEFFGKREHYKLLAHLTTLLPPGATVVDIGTHRGDSALSLSYSRHLVDTFDVVDKTSSRGNDWNTYKSAFHLSAHIGDLFDLKTREAHRKTLLDSLLIVVDIDPHEGTRELELVEWLRDHDYGGIIVLDDIWYFKQMRDNLWSRIESRFKTDATSLGHWSGTGIVSFKQRVEIEGAPPPADNWTLVTGYFDLTKAPDANDAIKARPAEHYIEQHGGGVLGLDKNLIVFCEPELEPKIWAMRPKYLHEHTRVYTQSFEDFPLTRNRDLIKLHRGGACPSDPRNTASYYLFCMARYAMLKRAIRDAPFKSTHYAWINICIERMGFSNLAHLNEALGLNRNRFSTCWIDYVSKNLVEDLPRYFDGSACLGRCSMCSGFFTGRHDHMRFACDEIENAFFDCLLNGYGHADEQLFPIVHYRHPELFDWYIGDYTEMITNYAAVHEHPERPLRTLITNSFAADDKQVCKRACDILRESIEAGHCRLSPDDQAQFDMISYAHRDGHPPELVPAR